MNSLVNLKFSKDMKSAFLKKKWRKPILKILSIKGTNEQAGGGAGDQYFDDQS